MGVLKFRFDPPDLANELPELRSAYFTGMDRTPSRTGVELRSGLLICSREGPESGRLHVPWPVEGFGAVMLSTATLAERDEPYDLAVELARGRLNDVRNQAAEWSLMGLERPSEFDAKLTEAQRAFSRTATAQADPPGARHCAQACLGAALEASDLLLEAYTAQVLQRRLEFTSKLPTQLAIALDGDPKKTAGMSLLAPAFNAARLHCPWSRLAPTEGRFHWEEFDSQLAWARSNRLTVSAGPLIDLRPGCLPDWLWLWGGDYDQILGLVEDLVRQAVSRFRGKVPVWHLIARAGSSEVLGLSEEEQVRLTARALQVARRADPEAQFVVDFDRPWGDWMASSSFQLGPLHLADSLARAELGLAGIGLEIAPGYSPPGSALRHVLDVSRLLDLFALVNLPLYVNLVLPSGSRVDSKADPAITVNTSQWPKAPTEKAQRDLASRWLALAVAKPYVRCVSWTQAGDSLPHLYPHGGLLRPDGTAKPIVEWIKAFRGTCLD